MFFDQYPYTNFHNVNLDWVLQAVKSWGLTVEANNQAFIDLKAANESFKEYVTNFFNNLDVSDEISTKLDQMLEDGVLAPYMAPYIHTEVSGWLEEHITPTSPAVDKSLTISGAAADAAKVGSAIYKERDRTANIPLPLAYYSTAGLTALDFRLMPDNSYTFLAFSLISESFANTSMPEKWKDSDYVSVRKYAISKFADANAIYILYNMTQTRKLEMIWYKSASSNNYRWINNDRQILSTCDNTDRTAEIISMLTNYGVCNLGPGNFYVSGIDMLDDSCIKGSGPATKIILRNSITDGYAIKMGDRCIIDSLAITSSDTYTPTENIGTRNGILWLGSATASHPTSAKPIKGTITNCIISNFSGGGITCTASGTGINNCLNVSNVYISECTVGVNISFLSEFHRFTNVHCRGCYYGIINNGGNNTFSNCGFSKNIIGILMDNSSGQSTNNSHGTFCNCVINHSGQSNDGIAIKLLGMTAGEIFTGCNVFFGSIDVENCQGIVFADCNFKSGTAFTFSNSVVVFNGNMFTGLPTSEQTGTNTIISNACYTKTGESVTL